MGKTLGISQDVVFRLGSAATFSFHMRKSVQAMGGNLSLLAEFPNPEPVVLFRIAEVEL
jgi:hypothetical protein